MYPCTRNTLLSKRFSVRVCRVFFLDLGWMRHGWSAWYGLWYRRYRSRCARLDGGCWLFRKWCCYRGSHPLLRMMHGHHVHGCAVRYCIRRIYERVWQRCCGDGIVMHGRRNHLLRYGLSAAWKNGCCGCGRRSSYNGCRWRLLSFPKRYKHLFVHIVCEAAYRLG